MIPEKLAKVLNIVYEKLNNKVYWVLLGSTSLAIQGVTLEPHDIDISTDKEGIAKIDKLLSKFRTQKPEYSSTDKFKSSRGLYNIEGIQVDVMYDFYYKNKNGKWSKPRQRNPTLIEYKGMNLPVLTLQQEFVNYKNMGRLEKAKKIKEAMTKS